MPQMMPMLWILILIFNFFILMFSINFFYYFYINYFNLMNNNIKIHKFNYWYFKW